MKPHKIFDHWINNKDKESIQVFIVLTYVFGVMTGVYIEYILMGGTFL